MARLPQPGGDSGSWGDILNNFLGVEHNSDGSLKYRAEKGAINGIASLDGSGKVPASQLPTMSDATTTGKGVVQLAGDLAGTAAAPTVPGLTGKEPSIAPGTSAQYWRGDKTWQTLRRDHINLLDYLPAGPDGVANNAAIIRQAIIDAGNGPRRLFIPKQTNPWIIGTPVLVDVDIEVYSDSWGNTGANACIKLAAGLNDYGFKFDTARAGGNRITFRSIEIDGNHAAQTAGGIILANNPVQCLFDEVHLHNAYNTALYLKGQQGAGPFGHHNRIVNSLFDNSAGFGDGRGLVLESADETMVSSCDFENNGTFGAPEPYHVKDWSGINSFVNCVFVGGGEGIRMQDISGSRVVGCMFDGLGKDAVHVSGSNVQVSANHFSGINTSTPNSNFHLFLDNGGYSTVTGNMFDSGTVNNALRGFVSHQNSSTFDVVTGNVFRVNTGSLGSGGVYDWNGSSAAGTSSIVKTNIGLADQ